MNNSNRLIYLDIVNNQDITELWSNCFEGVENQNHMNAFVPFPVTQQYQLSGFIKSSFNNNFKIWLVKRKVENDIIGFIIHGDFFPGQKNSIGFNIGYKYTRQGYACEVLNELFKYLDVEGLRETFGHCYENNISSVNTMVKCGFVNQGYTGKNYGNNKELKFRKIL